MDIRRFFSPKTTKTGSAQSHDASKKIGTALGIGSKSSGKTKLKSGITDSNDEPKEHSARGKKTKMKGKRCYIISDSESDTEKPPPTKPAVKRSKNTHELLIKTPVYSISDSESDNEKSPPTKHTVKHSSKNTDDLQTKTPAYSVSCSDDCHIPESKLRHDDDDWQRQDGTKGSQPASTSTKSKEVSKRMLSLQKHMPISASDYFGSGNIHQSSRPQMASKHKVESEQKQDTVITQNTVGNLAREQVEVCLCLVCSLWTSFSSPSLLCFGKLSICVALLYYPIPFLSSFVKVCVHAHTHSCSETKQCCTYLRYPCCRRSPFGVSQ
uniref:Uncharacterized protein n=1 Tax=Eptatretus burgeri TaxID=7764 RepID=A0A8C4X1S2_EPTBU